MEEFVTPEQTKEMGLNPIEEMIHDAYSFPEKLKGGPGLIQPNIKGFVRKLQLDVVEQWFSRKMVRFPAFEMLISLVNIQMPKVITWHINQIP